MAHHKDFPIEDLKAGHKFRETLISRADDNQAGSPLWRGWALMEAFLAGLDHARNEKDRQD